MSPSRRSTRSWVSVAIVAVLGVAPIAVVLSLIWAGLGGELFDESTTASAGVLVCAIAAVTGLATSLTARLGRWWLLVPVATSTGACVAVLVIGPWVLAPEVSIVPGAAWVSVALGSLAGVALVDHLTSDGGRRGDAVKPDLLQEEKAPDR
jgi:hypothetical protein